jgi:hypothetical protein
MASPNLWYIRRGEQIQGPFPAGLVRRYVLLGRINDNDELSTDRQSWAPLLSFPDLAEPGDEAEGDDGAWARERQQAQLRWEDERSGLERRADGATRDADGSSPERRGGDRRQPDTGPRSRRLRPRRASGTAQGTGRERYVLRWLGLGAFIAALILLAVLFPDRYPTDASQCGAPPQPQIDWSDCRLDGARLAEADLQGANLRAASLIGAAMQRVDLSASDVSYANFSMADLGGSKLRGATMVGASMRGTVLAGANLEGANLSYAILAGADLGGANLKDARLDHAIWLDNRVCGAGSVGRCLAAEDGG